VTDAELAQLRAGGIIHSGTAINHGGGGL
jgi:hypothetical protein